MRKRFRKHGNGKNESKLPMEENYGLFLGVFARFLRKMEKYGLFDAEIG